MTEQVASSIEIPANISPANADAIRSQALTVLEAAKEASTNVWLDVDGDAMTPVAVQMLISTMRTADRFSVSLNISEQCQTVLTDLQLN